MGLGGRVRMTIALLATAAGTGGCLVVDPVLPLEDGPNQNPEIFFEQPDHDETVFVSNTPSTVTFKVRADDDSTPQTLLNYEWSVDNGVPIQSGPNLREFTTSGATLGAGIHIIGVFITDDDEFDVGFVELEWTV